MKLLQYMKKSLCGESRDGAGLSPDTLLHSLGLPQASFKRDIMKRALDFYVNFKTIRVADRERRNTQTAVQVPTAEDSSSDSDCYESDH